MGSTETIPEEFDGQFLDWFRARTEATWADYTPASFGAYVAAGIGGTDWQQGTRWLGGLSDAEILSVERKWGLRFPPDYRLFLQRLHAVDRPKTGARWNDELDERTQRMIPIERPGFRNWLTDDEDLRDAFEWLVEGLQFDIEYNQLWLPGWGEKPATLAEQKERVRGLVASAPRMIPIIGHRYLLAEPCIAGNPVFSIYQADIIVYGPDLRTYLLFEFCSLLGLDRRKMEQMASAGQHNKQAYYPSISFWGEVYDYNNTPLSQEDGSEP